MNRHHITVTVNYLSENVIELNCAQIQEKVKTVYRTVVGEMLSQLRIYKTIADCRLCQTGVGGEGW